MVVVVVGGGMRGAGVDGADSGHRSRSIPILPAGGSYGDYFLGMVG